MSNIYGTIGEQVLYDLKMRYGKRVDIIHFVRKSMLDPKTGMQSPPIVERFTIPKAMVLDIDAIREYGKDISNIPYGGMFDTDDRFVIIPTVSLRPGMKLTETDQLEFIQFRETLRWSISKLAVSEPLGGHAIHVKRVKS